MVYPSVRLVLENARHVLSKFVYSLFTLFFGFTFTIRKMLVGYRFLPVSKSMGGGAYPFRQTRAATVAPRFAPRFKASFVAFNAMLENE